jgi:hypothetical protein
MINKDLNPIFYKNAEEMDKPLSELIENLRSDIAKIRGKLSDIRRSYGWVDRIEHIEGGLTCMLVAMHHTITLYGSLKNKLTL